jgi:hypothetical protein
MKMDPRFRGDDAGFAEAVIHSRAFASIIRFAIGGTHETV